MIFTFADGNTRSIEAGKAVRGLHIKNARPIDITFTFADVAALIELPNAEAREYLHRAIYHTMAVSFNPKR